MKAKGFDVKGNGVFQIIDVNDEVKVKKVHEHKCGEHYLEGVCLGIFDYCGSCRDITAKLSGNSKVYETLGTGDISILPENQFKLVFKTLSQESITAPSGAYKLIMKDKKISLVATESEHVCIEQPS